MKRIKSQCALSHFFASFVDDTVFEGSNFYNLFGEGNLRNLDIHFLYICGEIAFFVG